MVVQKSTTTDVSVAVVVVVAVLEASWKLKDAFAQQQKQATKAAVTAKRWKAMHWRVILPPANTTMSSQMQSSMHTGCTATAASGTLTEGLGEPLGRADNDALRALAAAIAASLFF